MGKKVYAGELNALVRFVTVAPTINENGFSSLIETDIFPKPCRVQWVWQHRAEVFENMKYKLNQKATITMYYSPKINQQCRVYLEGDDAPDSFEIISIDNVQDTRRYMEIKIKREVKA